MSELENFAQDTPRPVMSPRLQLWVIAVQTMLLLLCGWWVAEHAAAPRAANPDPPPSGIRYLVSPDEWGGRAPTYFDIADRHWLDRGQLAATLRANRNNSGGDCADPLSRLPAGTVVTLALSSEGGEACLSQVMRSAAP